MPRNAFEIDVAAIRDNSRKQSADGPLTSGNDAARLIDVLNQVVATEIVCVMRYGQTRSP